MTTSPRTIECTFPGRDRRPPPPEDAAGPPALVAAGRVSRVSRLMALALRFEELLRQGVVADYAALARLGHVSRARISQIMNLLVLSPDIQEALLFLPPTEKGRDPIHLGQLQPLAALLDWRQQRRRWLQLAQAATARTPPS